MAATVTDFVINISINPDRQAVVDPPIMIGAMFWRPVAPDTEAINVGDGVLIKTEVGRGVTRSASIDHVRGLCLVERVLGKHAQKSDSEADPGVDVTAYALLPMDGIGDGWVRSKSLETDTEAALARFYCR